MSEPRHPNRSVTSPLRLSLVVALLITCSSAACYQESEPPKRFVPGDPLYEQFTTTGERTIVELPKEEAQLKVRQRRRDTRVYDAQMIPVGRVVVDEESGEITRYRIGEGTGQTVSEADDTAILDGAWRLERVDDDRRDLFDAQGRLIALWRRHDDGHWILRPTMGSPTTLRCVTDGPVTRVVDGQDTVYLQAHAREWSDVKVMALTLEGLDPLERYTLARWVDAHL